MEAYKQFILTGVYFSPDVAHIKSVDNLTFVVKIYDSMKDETNLKLCINKIIKVFSPLEEQLRDSILNYTIPELKKITTENLCPWLWDKLSPELPTMTKLVVQIR